MVLNKMKHSIRPVQHQHKHNDIIIFCTFLIPGSISCQDFRVTTVYSITAHLEPAIVSTEL